MKIISNFRLTSFAFAFITLIAIPTAIAGQDSVISGAIIQADWCGQGNYICLIRVYVYTSIIILIVCFLLDLLFNWIFVKSIVSINPETKFLDSEHVGDQTWSGMNAYLDLEVRNNTFEGITECYGMLEIDTLIAEDEKSSEYINFSLNKVFRESSGILLGWL